MKMNLNTNLIFAGVGALMLGGFSLVPASADAWGHDINHDRNDLRSDRQDARHDVRDLRYDHTQANSLDRRQDIRRDNRDLRSDRRAINYDKRDLRHDW